LDLVYASRKFNTTDVGRYGESNYGELFNKIGFGKIFLTTGKEPLSFVIVSKPGTSAPKKD
jgi:hypothetical protein